MSIVAGQLGRSSITARLLRSPTPANRSLPAGGVVIPPSVDPLLPPRFLGLRMHHKSRILSSGNFLATRLTALTPLLDVPLRPRRCAFTAVVAFSISSPSSTRVTFFFCFRPAFRPTGTRRFARRLGFESGDSILADRRSRLSAVRAAVHVRERHCYMSNVGGWRE